MWFVALGVLALALKLSGFTAVADWPWWAVLSPFGAAAAWWTIADLLGITQRDALRRLDEKVKRRRQFHLDAMGMSTKSGSQSKAPRDSGFDVRDRHNR